MIYPMEIFFPPKIKEIIPIGIFQNPREFVFFRGNFENSHGNINFGWILLQHGKICFKSNHAEFSA